MNIKDRILEIVPEAQFAEQGDLTATIPAESFHALAEKLRYDEDAQFDFLLSLTGMDWGETLGVVYHLESTKYGHSIVLKTMTANRENPELPSVTDLWKTADFNEREVFDFFGIRFVNHSDMRRLYLREDWVGYPLRKDYDDSLNPLRMTNEVTEDTTDELSLDDEGNLVNKTNSSFRR
jgi:NADH:ubiquinone oxidoreductase 27 kD subunit